MEPISKIFEYLKESNLTMIGYKFRDERTKDELISKIPCIEIFEFDSSFSVMAALKQKVRERKIGSVIDGEYFLQAEFLVVDLAGFRSKSDEAISRSKEISDMVEEMRAHTIGTEYKLIVLSPVNSNPSGEVPSFRGGSRSLYAADLVYMIEGRKINILKNRFDGDNISISLDGLKDYKYICSYENNK